jgi:hypothetical protein
VLTRCASCDTEVIIASLHPNRTSRVLMNQSHIDFQPSYVLLLVPNLSPIRTTLPPPNDCSQDPYGPSIPIMGIPSQFILTTAPPSIQPQSYEAYSQSGTSSSSSRCSSPQAQPSISPPTKTISSRKTKRIRTADLDLLKLESTEAVDNTDDYHIRKWTLDANSTLYDCSCGARRTTHDKRSIKNHIRKMHIANSADN